MQDLDGLDELGLIARSSVRNKKAMHSVFHRELGGMHPCRRFHEAQGFSSGRVITWHTCGNLAKVDKRSDAISSLGATEVRSAMH